MLYTTSVCLPAGFIAVKRKSFTSSHFDLWFDWVNLNKNLSFSSFRLSSFKPLGF